MRSPERAEARREAGNPARGDADRVVHQLLAERHLQLDQLGVSSFAAEPGDGDEAVEVRRLPGAGVVVDAVAAAQEAGHHGLGDARGERRRDRRVGGASALGEDLGARGGGGGMACGDRLHPESFASSLPFP